MNSFKLTAVGNLARDPDRARKGTSTVAVSCRVGKDVVTSEGTARKLEVMTTLWFEAYDALGEEIVANARRGDRLIVEAIAQTMMGSHSPYDHTYIVKGFRFGARRGGDNAARASPRRPILPDATLTGTAETETATRA